MSKYLLKYEGKETELRDGVYVLGRSKECDIRFQNESVSRRHAKLTILRDKIFVEDTGSSNGSFINGKLIRGEILVHPEDRLHFGKVVLIIKKIAQEESLPNRCPACNYEVPVNMVFCIQCGASMKKESEPVAIKAGDSTAELISYTSQSQGEEPDTHESGSSPCD